MGLINRLKSFFLSNNKAVHLSASSIAQLVAIDRSKTPKIPIWLENNEDLFFQLEDKYYQYFIGVNSLLDLKLNSFEASVIASLEKTIKLEHSIADEIPRLPEIVPKLIHLLRTDDFAWKDVADLIATDPVILVGIIKIANSSMYNLQIKDDKLDLILAQLGLQEVREVIMKVALKPIMLVEGGHFLNHSSEKIWDYSVKSAVACRILAKKYKQEIFDAYLAGLLSNIGMTIVIKKMNEIKEFKTAPRSVQFKEQLLKLSKQLSIKIAYNWELDPDVILALAEQMFSNAREVQSPLGIILYEGTAVSMEYILVNENRWIQNERVKNEMKETAFYEAYQQLEAYVER